MKTRLRIISLLMFVAAVVFVLCALSCPNCGSVIYIGSFRFGVEQKLICYKIYAAITVALFIASFFVKDKKK